MSKLLIVAGIPILDLVVNDGSPNVTMTRRYWPSTCVSCTWQGRRLLEVRHENTDRPSDVRIGKGVNGQESPIPCPRCGKEVRFSG